MHGHPRAQDYVKQYNAQLRALREEFGLPSWAPGSRLPERRRLLEWMSDAHPVTTWEMKTRDFACPHCHVLTRGFRFLPRSEGFVCPSCSRSSAALAFQRP